MHATHESPFFGFPLQRDRVDKPGPKVVYCIHSQVWNRPISCKREKVGQVHSETRKRPAPLWEPRRFFVACLLSPCCLHDGNDGPVLSAILAALSIRRFFPIQCCHEKDMGGSLGSS